MWSEPVELNLQELVGEGSQGRVFKALRRDRETGLSQTVAVKILNSRNAVELWRNEFESLRRVRSPFCVQVFSFDRIEGSPALVLEYVEGVTLKALADHSLLRAAEVAELSLQIESGLRALAEEGVFHGDLSPRNVLVDGEGRVRLLDFGLANSLGDQIRLTPEFAARERLNGQKPDLRSDLISLAKIESFLLGRKGHGNWDSKRRPNRDSNPTQRRRLGGKVQEILKERAAQQAQKTKVLNAPPPAKKLNLLGPCLLFLFLGSSSLRLHGDHPKAVLRLRSDKWFAVKLDGRDLGYAPMDLEISDRKTHRLEWRNRLFRGQRTLQLRPGETLTLTDRDLTH